MCVANLNVSLQPCGHRWYQLVRQCSDSTNLSNCPQKVRLEGWETRVEDCPWCTPTSPNVELDLATHKLFGGNDFCEARRRSDSTVASLESMRGRTNSVSTLSNITSRSTSPESSPESGDADRAERNRLMNRRVNAYIVNAVPESITLARSASSPKTTSPMSSATKLAVQEKDASNTAPSRKSSLLGRWGGGSSTKKKKRFSII